MEVEWEGMKSKWEGNGSCMRREWKLYENDRKVDCGRWEKKEEKIREKMRRGRGKKMKGKMGTKPVR